VPWNLHFIKEAVFPGSEDHLELSLTFIRHCPRQQADKDPHSLWGWALNVTLGQLSLSYPAFLDTICREKTLLRECDHLPNHCSQQHSQSPWSQSLAASPVQGRKGSSIPLPPSVQHSPWLPFVLSGLQRPWGHSETCTWEAPLGLLDTSCHFEAIVKTL
jgi:hypothetical protein